MTVLADVEAALPVDFKTAREIWKDLGRWSPMSVGRAVSELCRQGKAEKKGVPWSGKPLVYRRKP